MDMKKRAFLISVLLFILTLARAAYFENLPYTIRQPDGKVINCFVSGDEFFNWIHDQEGFTIIQSQDGYFYYAEQDGDLLKPSIYLVNSVNPSSVGLIKGVKISKKEYQRRYDAMFGFEKTAKGGPVYAPHSGSMNNLVIYIRFADDSEFTTTRQTFDNKFNPVTGVTLLSYFKEVSYSNLTISSSHYPACALTTNLSFQDSHTRNYFQPYNATTNPTGYNGDSEKTSREHTLLAAAINWINTNSPVPGSLNIDGDGDNNIDNVCFVIKGSNGAWNDLLWAHRWALYTQNVTINSKRVYDYTFQPESQVSVTTLCHEMFHALGSPDLYHYTNQGVIKPAGRWDIMDGGSGHMLTYMKWKYSQKTWISTIPEITGTGTYTLNPVTSSTNNCYKIGSPNSTVEYFMVEYRNKSGTFETNIPGSGLIVYRIDTRVTGNASGPPDEVYVYRPGGTPSANGNADNAFFSSTISRTAINDATDPSSFLQNGSAGGLKISNVTTAGTTISFTVTFPPPPPAPVANPATSVIQTSFTANWSSSATATGYKLDISTNNGFTSFVAGFNNLDVNNVTSYNVIGLNPKTVYYYRVKAYNFGGTGANSGTITLTTLTTPSSAPSNMTAVSCNDLLTLKWRKSAGPDFLKYRIYGGTSTNPTTKIDSITNNISDTSKVLYGLIRGQTYYFRVTAVNYDGPESSFSNQSTETVKTGVIPKIKTKWGDVLVCYNLGDSIKSYQWYKGGIAINGETTQYYKTDKKSGVYMVQTIDLNGCKNSSMTMPMPLSGVNSISVYPNPASVNFTLKMNNESVGKAVITIFNSVGTRVMELQTEKIERELLKEIPVTILPRGIYHVQVLVNNEDLYLTQIVVVNR
jgi:M6 family metalloprotease-like protein